MHLRDDERNLLTGYVQGLARNGRLDQLPTSRLELLELAREGGPQAANGYRILAAMPEFTIRADGQGNIGLWQDGIEGIDVRPAHVWNADDLEAHARQARDAHRGRYDGDY